MTMSWRLVAIALACSACKPQAPNGPAQRSPTPPTLVNSLKVETVASGLVHPWAIAFLPDGRMLVTERPGRLRFVERDGRLSAPLTGLPPVIAVGQGGLMDITLDPQFERNKTIYLSYVAGDDEGKIGTTVARARVGAKGLDSVRIIYQQLPRVSHGDAFGSRIVIAPDGRLFIVQGDRFDVPMLAQDPTNLLGKIVRIDADGGVPSDNPFVGRSDARPEIWSLGHRNIQGAAIDPATGRLWVIEHGPAGGDELNQPEAGKNYGWPVITYGLNYNGRRIGQGAVKNGMEQPVYYWNPVISPGGMAIYTGDRFPGWRGSFLLGSMRNPGGLVRLTMLNGKVVAEERHLGELREPVRDVQQGPDGLIYVTMDSSGRILRLSPK
jgi:glucose/arabinose dehydrogenase